MGEYHWLCPVCGRGAYGSIGGYNAGKAAFLHHLRRHGIRSGEFVDSWIRYVTSPPAIPRMHKAKRRRPRKKKIGLLGY